MLRSLVLASAFALGIAGAATAQSYPALIGSGDNATVEYGAGQRGSVVGGGAVQMTGIGDEARFTYVRVESVPGRVARLVGSRDDAQVVYEPETSVSRGLAGGGGGATGG
jgi:hypothetical protein